jgi:glucuronokinase
LIPPIVEGRAFARAGLLGNPSDGYFGRTLSACLQDFHAKVTLHESAELRILPAEGDLDVFGSVEHLIRTLDSQGYYGGPRLLKAAIRVFFEYCRQNRIQVLEKNFTLDYASSIPRQVGLGGSSAIVTAALRALMAFYEVEIPREEQPGVILSAEMDELGITAGLQDRVIQVFEGLVYMDFSNRAMDETGPGFYEPIDPSLLPRLFLAYRTVPGQASGVVHGDLRSRWEAGDSEVSEVLGEIADLASLGREALLEGRLGDFSSMVDHNFDLRCRIMSVDGGDLELVRTARAMGASAKLTGSGGAIIGVIDGDEEKERVQVALDDLGAQLIEPTVGQGSGGTVHEGNGRALPDLKEPAS